MSSAKVTAVVSKYFSFLTLTHLHHYLRNTGSCVCVCVCVCTCVWVTSLPAFLWSWALTVSFAEFPDSAITGSARSGWTGIVQALKIKFTPTHKQTHSLLGVIKWVINPPLRVQRMYRKAWLNLLLWEIRFGSCMRKENSTHPLRTCPSPLILAAMQPPCSGRYCRRLAGCCCCCCWGPPAATASCLASPAVGSDLSV